MKTNEDYKHMTTNELIEMDRRLTEIFWKIANEITMEDGYDVHEKSTALLEAISDQIEVIEDLMLKRNDLLEWPQPIIALYKNRGELIVYDRY